MSLPAAALLASCVVLIAGSARGDTDAKVRVVATPPTEGENAFYTCYRAPLMPNPLVKLPIGAIKPAGWLRHLLELEADGMTGHLTEISPWCDKQDNAWLSPQGEGKNGWEELPYWLKGFGDLGYVLGDERITKEARIWLDATLASQGPDGYFGPRANKQSNDLWPNMIMLNALQSFQEATGDERVIPFMTRYFHWVDRIPPDQLLPGSWQKVRAGDMLESVYWLYNRTGESWLLDLAKKVHEHTANWTEGFPTWHGVNICQGFREPAEYWVLSHDPKHLQATEQRYQEVMDLYGQCPGGMFGADENCREGYRDPRQAAETCSIIEFMHSDEMLMTFTGQSLYADRCEEVALNSAPVAQPPDLKGLHYLTATNQPQLDKENKAPGIQNGGNMFAYDPYGYRCCQHNISHGWPYYAEHLFMGTRDNGLAAVLYCASTVTAEVGLGPGTPVTITEDTDYPFGAMVNLKLSMPRTVAFTLYLRIPRWCSDAQVKVNGAAQKVEAEPGGYVAIDRTWKSGDQVALDLPMRISVRAWPTNNDAVSVHRGPLAYSLRIGEKWVRYGGTDAWPAYEVLPTTPWNCGLVLSADDPAGSFEVVRRDGPVPSQPFTPDTAPVELIAKARLIPNWRLERGLCPTLQKSPIKSAEPVTEIRLIPMGCARLRLAAFPVIGDGPDGREWEAPPPPRHEVSHCWSNDTVDACSDGQLPKSSNDQSIPRFTWWDHLGTEEWITYRLGKPRQVSECEVYWFDDTGVGMCRVPESWQLLWRDGKEWKPIESASAYGTRLDQFSKVTFSPVTTTELKIMVRLQKGFSGGILEWRVGP